MDHKDEDEDEDEYKDKVRRRQYYSTRRDERSPSQSRSRSQSLSPAHPRYVKSKSEQQADFLKNQKKMIKPYFEDLCDSFSAELLRKYNSGALINYDLIKTETYNFYLEYARTNATAIVTDLLHRLPTSDHSRLLEAKAVGFLINNDYADIKVQLQYKDVEDLVRQIQNIFETELQKQKDEKQTDALSEMLASANIAKGNKTYYTNKKIYRRKKNTYNSRNKKSKNKKPKNKKTYHHRNKKQ
jgi:hypothetical protein